VAAYAEKELGVPGDRIVYFGQSLGCGVATQLAARRPPARLILESAYLSLAEVAAYHYRFLPVRLLMRDRFDSTQAISRISCPLLLLHPAEDEIIPLRFGQAFFARAGEPKRFVALPGAHHNDTFEVALDQQIEAIGDFLEIHQAAGAP